jgi:luciferase family oxidoreductase group 1
LLRFVTTKPTLSVLDLAPVPEGSTPAEALRRSTELIRLAERLGYHRYWVAEHHNMPGIASSSPPVLIAHLAAATERIRVGSGGVMLPNHAPLVVAEQFGTLEALHPGRIDLGIGRAPGTDQHTARALRRDASPGAEEFPAHLYELMGYFDGKESGITAVPGAGYGPPIWRLGSSDYSARLAAALGLPFSFAHHFAGEYTLPAAQLYRAGFRPSDAYPEPHLMLGVAVYCADTEAEAERMAASQRLSMVRLRQGRPGPLPSPDEALAYPYTDLDQALLAQRATHSITGTPTQVATQLTALTTRTGAQELMLTTIAYDHSARLHSYELIAEQLIG